MRTKLGEALRWVLTGPILWMVFWAGCSDNAAQGNAGDVHGDASTLTVSNEMPSSSLPMGGLESEGARTQTEPRQIEAEVDDDSLRQSGRSSREELVPDNSQPASDNTAGGAPTHDEFETNDGEPEIEDAGLDAGDQPPDTGGSETRSTNDITQNELTPRSIINYGLAFDLSGVELLEDGSWQTTNERGDEIHLTDGFVINYLAALVPCQMWEGEMGLRWPGYLLRLAGISVAHAGHPGELDPSTVMEPIAESLTDPIDTDFGAIGVDAFNYCKVHYLVGRADTETRLTDGLSAEDIADISLMVAGNWRPSGETEWRAFRVETGFSYGNLKALYPPGQFGIAEAAFELNTGTTSARVTIMRRLEKLFWEVDLSEENQRSLELSVLRGLVKSSRFEVVARPINAAP